MARCEFFYDFSSPYAYLGATQIERVCAGHELVWRPFLLGALFQGIGTPTVPIATFPPAKVKLLLADQYRWADHWGVPFRFPSRFPQKSLTALRVALAAPPQAIGPLSRALFEIAWVEDGDLEDRAALAAAIGRVGLDAASILEAAGAQPVKDALRANTDEAVARGVCGAPTAIVGDRLFWGQDRLHFVEKALAGWAPPDGERVSL